MEHKLDIPYIGGILSDNSYKVHNSKATKPFVKMWMKDLSTLVSNLNIPKCKSYKILLHGHFQDNRHPDLHNLHKVIGDALKVGLGVDDKFISFEDCGVDVSSFDPYLEITIIEGDIEVE